LPYWFPVAGPLSAVANTAGSFLSATGYRDGGGAPMNHTSTSSEACYWSSTPISNANAYFLQGMSTSVAPVNNRTYGSGHAVRCVRDY